MNIFARAPHPKNYVVNFLTSPQGGGEDFNFRFHSNLPLVGRSDCKAIRVGGAD